VNALAFDVNAACSGFLFALNTADVYLRTGLAENALVIGSEVLSKLVDWTDRGSCILFGDGAGAVVVERCRTESRAVEYSNALPETEKGMQETAEEKRIPAAGILGRALHSDGTGGGVLQCGARELTTPYARTSAAKTDQNQPTDGREHYIQMDGQEVYRFATRRVPQCIEEALSDAGLAVPDIDMFVLHQANARIIDAVAKRLHADRDKFPTNLERVGNMSSASIPVLLDELHRQGKKAAPRRPHRSGGIRSRAYDWGLRDDLVDGILITTKDTTTAWTRSGRQEACGPGVLPVYQRDIYWENYGEEQQPGTE